MGTAIQIFWPASSGALLVPRSCETTAKRFTPSELAVVQTTGGSYAPPECLVVSAEEREWAALLSVERQVLAKKRMKSRTVDRAIREARYGK